jgi:hypothetical protein
VIEACAIRHRKTGKFLNFGKSRNATEWTAELSIRCLRTEAGCKSWLRGNKYTTVDLGASYELVKYRLEPVEHE